GGAVGGGGGAVGGGGGAQDGGADGGVDGGVDGGKVGCTDAGTFTLAYRSPRSVVNHPSAVDWVDGGLVGGEDGLVASTAQELQLGQTTTALVVTGFGFNVPQHAEIDSITLRIKRAASASGIADYRLQLVLGGFVRGEFAPGGAWPLSQADATYTLIAAGWTRDMVNDASFGVSLVAVNGGTTGARPLVDLVSITVQARVPGGYFGPVTATQVINFLVGGSGYAAWDHPEYAQQDDGGLATATVVFGQESQWLYFDNFSLVGAPNLPLSGVVFELKRKASGSGTVADSLVQLAPNGTFAGAPKSVVGPWSATETWVRYGSVNDLWGISTSTLASFDVGVAVVGTSGLATAEVNVGRLTLFYNTSMQAYTSAGTGSTGSAFPRAWTNPAGAALANDSQAATTAALTRKDLTELLLATGFGFAVPDDATIDSVDVEVVRRASGSGVVEDREVRLFVGGTSMSDNAAIAGAWDTNFRVQTYAFPGTKLIPADVNAVDFGVGLVAQSPGGVIPATPLVDAVRARVTYTCQ
ncbi:MAG: hypothetical protein AB1938_24615, partial [Myxococcota bacterium]